MRAYSFLSLALYNESQYALEQTRHCIHQDNKYFAYFLVLEYDLSELTKIVKNSKNQQKEIKKRQEATFAIAFSRRSLYGFEYTQ